MQYACGNMQMVETIGKLFIGPSLQVFLAKYVEFSISLPGKKKYILYNGIRRALHVERWISSFTFTHFFTHFFGPFFHPLFYPLSLPFFFTFFFTHFLSTSCERLLTSGGLETPKMALMICEH